MTARVDRARDRPHEVGFAGLGAMGRGMARNLHKRRPADGRLESHAGTSPRELADGARRVRRRPRWRPRRECCDVIVICVSADADVLAVVDALAPGLARRRARHRLLDGQRRHGARGGAAARRARASSFSTRRSAAASKVRATARSRSWSAATPAGVRARAAGAARDGPHGHALRRTAAPARRPRPPTRSCAPASSRRSPRRWRSRRPRGCRSSS